MSANHRAHIDRAALRRRELNAMATRFPQSKTVLDLRDGDPDKLHREACTLIPLFHRPAVEAACRSPMRGSSLADRVRRKLLQRFSQRRIDGPRNAGGGTEEAQHIQHRFLFQ